MPTKKKNVQHSKYDPGVQEVDLLECNPQYAHVRMPDGRETTVSLRQLAPCGESSRQTVELQTKESSSQFENLQNPQDLQTTDATEDNQQDPEDVQRTEPPSQTEDYTGQKEFNIGQYNIPKCLRPHNNPGLTELNLNEEKRTRKNTNFY